MAGRMSLLFGVVALGPAISVASIANRGAVYEFCCTDVFFFQ